MSPSDLTLRQVQGKLLPCHNKFVACKYRANTGELILSVERDLVANSF